MSIRIDRASNPVPGLLRDDVNVPAPVEKGYWEQLVALFPVEMTALYLGGVSIIPTEQVIVSGIWLVLGIAATIIVKGEQLKKHPQDPNTLIPRDKSHITVAVISFIIWAYAIGGFFTDIGWYLKWVAGLLVLAWTFAAPRVLPLFDKLFVKKT